MVELSENPAHGTWARAVKGRDSYTCQECGKTSKELGTKKIHAHRIIPGARGGKMTVENGVTLCGKCHREAHKGENSSVELGKVNPKPSPKRSKKARIEPRPQVWIETRIQLTETEYVYLQEFSENVGLHGRDTGKEFVPDFAIRVALAIAEHMAVFSRITPKLMIDYEPTRFNKESIVVDSSDYPAFVAEMESRQN